MCTGPSRRLPRGAVTAALFLFLLLPAGAGARALPTIFDAGLYITHEATPQQRQERLTEIERLGTETLRVVVRWRDFVPDPESRVRPEGFEATEPTAYPARKWETLDQLVRGAERRGMEVLLTPSGPIPDWASRARRASPGGEDSIDPDPQELRRFVIALGRRYSGFFVPPAPELPIGCPGVICTAPAPLPRVEQWALWNEPNQAGFLLPQFRDGKPYSPLLYRRLFVAGQAGLRASGHGSDLILIGETATTGGIGGVHPMVFLRKLFCLNRRYRPVRACRQLDADGWGHHPYGYSLPPHLRPPNPAMINIATLARLSRGLRRAAAAGAVTHPLPVYITEFGVLTVPWALGVSLSRQVSWLAISEFIAWRNPQVRSWAQYLLRDDSPTFATTFTSGLRFSDGREKLAYRAFAITLMVRALGAGRVRIWGHVRPARGPLAVTIRARRRQGTPFVLRRLVTDREGYFAFGSRASPGRRWQATSELPDGRRLAGPFVSAYRFP